MTVLVLNEAFDNIDATTEKALPVDVAMYPTVHRRILCLKASSILSTSGSKIKKQGEKSGALILLTVS